MTKAKTASGSSATPVAPAEVPQPQPVQPQYYQQPVYAPRPPKVAKHPGMELSLAVFSVLASAWLTIDALAGAIAYFGGGRLPSFDLLSSLLFSHFSGYTGVVIAGLGAVIFALAAFLLFRRLSAALESDQYKAALHVGAGIAVIKTGVLAVTTVAAGLTPLLTIQKGVNVGSVYLYDFLPLILATGLFAFVSWSMLKLVDKQRVASILSSVLLIVASLVFILAFVSVIIRSHAGSSSSSSSSGSSSSLQELPSSSSNNSSSGSSISQCYDDYRDSEDYQEYLDCLDSI